MSRDPLEKLNLGNVLIDVGPEDVDSASELVGNGGIRYQAKHLIRRVLENHPAELTRIQSLPEDPQRTIALDLEEVLDAAKDAFGAKDIVSLESARVRGSGAEDGMAVELLWYTPSGRTARAAIPYEGLKTSRQNFADQLAAGAVVLGDPDDPVALRRALDRANAELADLRNSESESAPEPPVPHYDKLTAPDLIANVEAGKYTPDQLDALEAAETAEGGLDRVTVQRAIGERREVLNPYPEYAESNAQQVIAYVKADDPPRSADELSAIRVAEEARADGPRATVIKALDSVSE